MSTGGSPLDRLMRFCLEQKLVVVLVTLSVVVWGILVAPFDWDLGGLPRNPVPVDAIPDIGENQQIVFTEWMGRSPQDVEDQVSYPLTVALLGIPGIKTVRSYSFFGFSSIYLIFDENVEFYWSRSRILEKLASLPPGTLPSNVRPALGPDATALGQVFWYTLEGRDPDGNPTGGWDLQELRTIQDYTVRYALQSARGVSEAASVGGHVKEYQIDADPDAMRVHGVALTDLFSAVQRSNVDVGARTVEINRVEYFIRGLGFIRSVADIENTVVRVANNVPLYIKDVAHVSEGPALRRGILDKEGAEAVGGVVVARYGENPLATIKAVKEKINEIAPGLPRKTLADGTVSQVTIVPFYDRTGLIYETLGTLNSALVEEILVTIIVVLLLVMHLRSSILISSMLPVTVLITFIGMKAFGVDANIVALSGIAIAIGTIVDMGIVLVENILKHLENAGPDDNRLEVVLRAGSEVGSAVLTAILTTVVSFLPVFTLEGAEGKLFKPLAYTKTFALLASVVVALTILPAAAQMLLGKAGARKVATRRNRILNIALVVAVGVFLASSWLPLGPERGLLLNFLFVAGLLLVVLVPLLIFMRYYVPVLRWCMTHRMLFLALPLVLTALGLLAWRSMGKEFMPALDEGSYLYMPTTMPHASVEEATDVVQKLNQAIYAVPEVDEVVGKIGRVESSLDPAPISMLETVVNYKPEYVVDDGGRRLKFQYDEESGSYPRDDSGELIPDRRGRPFRNWREHIRSADDIWDEIIAVAKLPGTTSAPKLQPIAARIVMLQSGMRAPMGVKIKGPDLETIERVGLEIERHLKNVDGVQAEAVFADRIVGKPYLEFDLDREALARYGLSVRQVQDVIEVGIGGRTLTTTVEGRERYPVRVRYPRELRGDIETLNNIIVPTSSGVQIPINQLAEIRYVRGPQVIKSEDTFLVGYVLFDKKAGFAEVDVVEAARDHLDALIADGSLVVPAGVSYTFAGSYENQVRSERKLRVVLPLALMIIFLILYFQFSRVPTTIFVFSGVFVAWAGGFLMLWLWGQPWFLDFPVLGVNLRDLFQMGTMNLSVAVWVGFLALFGIATDNGVIMATYLDQSFRERRPRTIEDVHAAVVHAGSRRIRPALMTSATTLLALMPVLTSTGRGADVMVPMAIPSFGGMCLALLAVLLVPVLYGWREERSLAANPSTEGLPVPEGGVS